MKLVELRWTPYAVPFARSFETARNAWRVREGAIVRAIADAGVTGVGEIAPLPSHGTHTLAGQLAALERVAPQLIGSNIESLGGVIDEAIGASVALAPLRCALVTAALDLDTRAADRRIAAHLASCAVAYVNVNTVIDVAETREAVEAAVSAVARGFSTVKLKIGAASSMKDEIARVAAVREAIGEAVHLRLDANGAWEEQQAIETLRALEGCGIELVEQPTRPEDIAALARVRAAVPQAIAADESVTEIDAAHSIIDVRAADAVVLKLPVVGGPLQAIEIARLACEAGLAVIITSAFDTGVGVAAALHVAAALAPPAAACGLATLDLLENDLIEPGLPVDSGTMRVPAGLGLGVDIDEHALERYATGTERVVLA